jgi:hypothetical protein
LEYVSEILVHGRYRIMIALFLLPPPFGWDTHGGVSPFPIPDGKKTLPFMRVKSFWNPARDSSSAQ